MKTIEEKLISIGNSYFDEIIRPLLKHEGLLDSCLVSFGGSIAYGYADKLSDIEIEISFKEKLDSVQASRIRSQIAKYPKFKNVKMGAGIAEGWKTHLVLCNKMKEFWKDIDPFALFEEAHLFPIWDPMNAAQMIKRRVSFYPQPVYLRVIRGLWLTANDSGSYNAFFAAKRGNETGTNIFLFRGVDALLKMIFLLNRKYYPPTKWITKEMDKLENTFSAKSYLERINQGKTPIDKQREFNFFVSRIKGYLRRQNDILTREEINDPWKIIKEPFFIHSIF